MEATFGQSLIGHTYTLPCRENMIVDFLESYLKQKAAEFHLAAFIYSCAGNMTIKDEPFPKVDSTHTRP